MNMASNNLLQREYRQKVSVNNVPLKFFLSSFYSILLSLFLFHFFPKELKISKFYQTVYQFIIVNITRWEISI
jgi:hypothetical protein